VKDTLSTPCLDLLDIQRQETGEGDADPEETESENKSKTIL
jgi:hypothetical protein